MGNYREVLERVGDRVPMPEPAFDRITRRRQRRERSQRRAAAALGIGITLVMLFALVTVVDRADPEPGGTPSPATVADKTPADLLPAPGTEPTIGGVGRLLFWYRSGSGNTTQFLFLYEDGRLVTNPGPYDADLDTRWVERRLTSDGVRLMLDAVAAADLPASGDVVVSGSRGWRQYSSVPGWERVVGWGPRSWISHPDIVADPGAVASFVHLGEQLDDPSDWLPGSAWERAQPLPFAPAMYLVTVEPLDERPASDEWLSSQRDLDELPIPAGVQLPSVRGCVAIDLEAARSLASALDATVTRFGWDAYIRLDPNLGYVMAWPALEGGKPVVVRIAIPLPHEDCDQPPDH